MYPQILTMFVKPYQTAEVRTQHLDVFNIKNRLIGIVNLYTKIKFVATVSTVFWGDPIKFFKSLHKTVFL